MDPKISEVPWAVITSLPTNWPFLAWPYVLEPQAVYWLSLVIDYLGRRFFSSPNNYCSRSLLSQAVVDSVLAVRRPGYPIDLFMVEIMEMKHKSETDTK